MFFIPISTKNATKHSKMTHKFGSNMNSHMQEWGGVEPNRENGVSLGLGALRGPMHKILNSLFNFSRAR